MAEATVCDCAGNKGELQNSVVEKATPEELAEIESQLEAWAISKHNATPDQVDEIKSCLQEEFLLAFVEPSAN